MNTTLKIVKYQLHDVIRSKWLIFYTIFFFLIAEGLFRFSGDSSKVVISLMNITLIIIPLVSIIYGTIYVYNSREFIELMLSQPIDRRALYVSMYVGLAFPLAAGFSIGVGIPFLITGFHEPGALSIIITLLASGILLTLVFTAIAFFVANLTEERIKGFGFAILIWFFFAVLYDGILLMVTYSFGEYPIERPIIILSMLNSIDLARILLMLQLDISALMGYTGAVFRNFFGSNTGIAVSFASLAVWVAVPFALGMWRFVRKDF